MADPVPDVAADTKTVRQGLPVGYARLVGHFAYYQAPEACYICTLLGALSAAEAEAAILRETLQTIARWDCLNPPNANLCSDHPWLKKLVDNALDEVKP